MVTLEEEHLNMDKELIVNMEPDTIATWLHAMGCSDLMELLVSIRS